MIISCGILLRRSNVSDKSCVENQNTQFRYSTLFFLPRKSCRLWDNVEKYGTAREAEENMANARCMMINKATRAQAHARARTPITTHACTYPHTHTHQYVTHIAFPRQQWFRERASVLQWLSFTSFCESHFLCQFRITAPVFQFSPTASLW
jgi:hypothetical protein